MVAGEGRRSDVVDRGARDLGGRRHRLRRRRRNGDCDRCSLGFAQRERVVEERLPRARDSHAVLAWVERDLGPEGASVEGLAVEPHLVAWLERVHAQRGARDPRSHRRQRPRDGGPVLAPLALARVAQEAPIALDGRDEAPGLLAGRRRGSSR